MLTPLVLLPGMMCDARLFTPLIEAVSCQRAVACYPLIAHNTIEGLAADVLAHAPAKFALAGLSMGGIVAMEMMRQAPERIERLALIDTNHLAESAEKAAARLPQIESVRRGRLWNVMRDEMKPNYLTDGPERGRILDLCMKMAMDLGDDVFIKQSEALKARDDYTDVLKQVNVPTLVMCGEDDELCTPERHRQIQALVAESELVIVKQAGHLVVQEQAVSSADAIQRWLLL